MPRLAGMIGLLNTDTANQFTEIGYIMTLPAFQRTHVTSNAIGLLLHYCLELPASAIESKDASSQSFGPGLGLRRVQWLCHAENSNSRRAAERMGFRFEGTLRWIRVLKEGKVGLAPSEARAKLCKGPGRHSCILSICWDDWEFEGVREHVQNVMTKVYQ